MKNQLTVEQFNEAAKHLVLMNFSHEFKFNKKNINELPKEEQFVFIKSTFCKTYQSVFKASTIQDAYALFVNSKSSNGEFCLDRLEAQINQLLGENADSALQNNAIRLSELTHLLFNSNSINGDKEEEAHPERRCVIS
ncbi:MAG: hypothetical protein WC785_07450 [Tatlockia sp.]|jgi:hypothetical protein